MPTFTENLITIARSEVPHGPLDLPQEFVTGRARRGSPIKLHSGARRCPSAQIDVSTAAATAYEAGVALLSYDPCACMETELWELRSYAAAAARVATVEGLLMESSSEGIVVDSRVRASWACKAQDVAANCGPGSGWDELRDYAVAIRDSEVAVVAASPLRVVGQPQVLLASTKNWSWEYVIAVASSAEAFESAGRYAAYCPLACVSARTRHAAVVVIPNRPVTETALRLWDPAGTGPLAQFTNAYCAAADLAH